MRDFVAWLDSFSFSLTSKAAQLRFMKSRQRFYRDFVAWLDSFSFSLTSKAAQPRCMKSRQRFH
jgi:hypothetical protein